MEPVHATDTPEPPPILAPLCSVFRRYLKAQSLRYTAERADILAAVMETEGLFDADSLLMDMRRQESSDVSKATVYRTLRLLQDAGIIMPFMLLDAKVTHYQLAYGREPSDYIVCMQTGRFEPLDCDEVVQLRNRLAAELGWKAVGHRFVIYGVAPDADSDSNLGSSAH